MAQASSVQREPSMEEILASIRRIIEDSDTARKGTLEDELPGEAEDAPVESAVIEVNAFRSELHEGRGGAADLFEPEPAQPEPARPVTLAEVQARIAAEAPVEQEAAQDHAADEPVAGKDADETPPAVAAAPAAGEREWSPQPSMAPVAAPEWTQPQDDYADAPRSQAAEPAREAPAPEAEVQMHAPGQVEVPAALRPTIISEQAGRQVAAAFGELSEAFAARSRKTFDDMAEQMMRPMLQDWLDNNLPTLVERLVREEIERVARGG